MEVMATNKETMNVIAKGMEKEATDRELTELNTLGKMRSTRQKKKAVTKNVTARAELLPGLD